MVFTVTSERADEATTEEYLKPSEAYRRARECEMAGLAERIRLPTGDEVTPEEFRELYLLEDLD